MTAQPPAPANPAAGAGPLTPDQAAWIRGNAWTPGMRKTHRTVPGLTSLCACQYGPSSHCRNDHHGRCVHGTPLPAAETYICGPDGETVLSFPRPYTHPTGSATGPQHETAALVWLADRVCRWVCPCPCGHGQHEPGPPVQLDLFGAAA